MSPQVDVGTVMPRLQVTTDEEGRVILGLTKDRVKLVTPGVGFGDKRVPTPEELELVERMWGK